MSQTIRTFIAVKIPSTLPLRRTIAAFGAMGDAVKPVSPEQLHVTLKFLGDTNRDQIVKIKDRLAAVATSRSAFTLDVFGIGAFPHQERPAVVWAGFRNVEPLTGLAVEPLTGLAKDLESRLPELGFPRERRAFHPHVTLARIRKRPPAELAELFTQYKQTKFGSVSIDDVRLYQSERAGDRPKYTLLEKVQLA